jgi:hypothetical protein
MDQTFLNNRTILEKLKKTMIDITTSYLKGIDPNDIAFKNTIRILLNKINKNNYNIILEELKALNYNTSNHYMLLVSELLLKSMNSPPDIYMNIVREFDGFCIKENNTDIYFRHILKRECQIYFKNFMNKNISMDRNNPHRVSNYNGFMSVIGILYGINIFPKEIIQTCFNKISLLVFDSKLSQDETDNYYNGYEKMLNRILNYFESNITTGTIDEFNIIKSYIDNFNTKIDMTCTNVNIKQRPIRMLINHKQSIKQLNLICEKYSQL